MFAITPLERFVKYLFWLSLILVTGCSEDEGPNTDPTNIDDFYSGSLRTASVDGLSGVWAIFSAQFEGKIAEVPVIYESCGRDFFVYSKDGTYSEYLYQSSACDPQINQLDWELDKGVISFSNALGQTDDFIITKLNDQELVFKTRYDVDEDGELDVLILFAKKYQPREMDLVTPTFKKNMEYEFEKLLSFTWDVYSGFNQFVKYEIYRSAGEGCSKANASLIATFNDATIGEFTDLDPPAAERLCYFIKIYTDKGLLGESLLYDVSPSSFVYADPVSLEQPIVMNNQIELNWEAYTSPYFSHYQITYANVQNSSPQEYTIAIITDKDITTFIHENPPYLENPIYSIYVHNIFGNRSSNYSQDVTSSWEVPFKRKEIIPLKEILSLDIDPEEPVIYIYGQLSGEGLTSVNIRRFNYDTHETESISDLNPQAQTSVPIKVFNSPNGKEVVIEQARKLHFYDAMTMEYKYAIAPQGVFGIDDFTYYSELDLWVIADSDNIFILQRDNANLFLQDSAPHFANHQGGGNYKIFGLKDNNILVGHYNEPNSMVFNLDNNGTIINDQVVPIQIKGIYDDITLYNKKGNYMLDTAQNRLYSTITFQFLESFGSPNFPSGTSKDGIRIFGSNNDPAWDITEESIHKKEALIFNRNTQSLQKVETIGYPQLIFENFKGDIISISSGLKRNRLMQNIYDKADLFVEKVNY